MSVDPPESASLRSVAERYGLGLADADLAAFSPLVDGLLASVDRRRGALRRVPPAAPERAWSRPEPADNPFNAWYVTTSITESGDGPLAGRTVAVKDNTAVAGVPMMNGSRTIEGYVPTARRDGRHPPARRGRHHRGQVRLRGPLLLRRLAHLAAPARSATRGTRRRSAGGSSSGSAALVAAGDVDLATGRRPGRLGAHPARLQRAPSATSRPAARALHRRVPHRADDRPPRPDHPHGRRRRAGAQRDRRAGRARPPPAPRLVPDDYVAALARGAEGLRVGVVTEGFGHPNSEPAVDDTVRAATETLRGAGPRRRGRLDPVAPARRPIWDVIATEGATAQMVDANGYGMNWKGLYDPELIDALRRRWRRGRHAVLRDREARAARRGRYALDTGTTASTTRWRATSPRARGRLRRRAGPTTTSSSCRRCRCTPPSSRRPDAPREEVVARALEMIANTCLFDVTGPPGLLGARRARDGLPAGMMIIGRHFDDATVLRVAHAFEQAVGGFPRPTTATVGSAGR